MMKLLKNIQRYLAIFRYNAKLNGAALFAASVAAIVISSEAVFGDNGDKIMSNKKGSKIILHKGEKINFRDMIEVAFGEWVGHQLPYFQNPNPYDKYGDWFEGDADYEIKITKKRKPKNL